MRVRQQRVSSVGFNPPSVRYPHPDRGGDSSTAATRPCRPFPPLCLLESARLASASELFLNALLFVQPLVGWGMLSAARRPIVWCGSLHLFPILPHNVMCYAVLGSARTVLGLPFVLDVPRPFWGRFVSHGVLRDEPSAVWRRGGFVHITSSTPAFARDSDIKSARRAERVALTALIGFKRAIL
jgi:hypothetical protein